MYNPLIGRFITRDPIGLAGGENDLVYCHNDPINRTDPEGLADKPWTAQGMSYSEWSKQGNAIWRQSQIQPLQPGVYRSADVEGPVSLGALADNDWFLRQHRYTIVGADGKIIGHRATESEYDGADRLMEFLDFYPSVRHGTELGLFAAGGTLLAVAAPGILAAGSTFLADGSLFAYVTITNSSVAMGTIKGGITILAGVGLYSFLADQSTRDFVFSQPDPVGLMAADANAVANGAKGAYGFAASAFRPVTPIPVKNIPHSPFQVHIDPISKEGPMAIDMSNFSGRPTSTGAPRNKDAFWKSWDELFGYTLSPKNKARIVAGGSPVVDEHWLQYFPEQQRYYNESLHHHHLDYGPDAIPLPKSLHIGRENTQVWHP